MHGAAAKRVDMCDRHPSADTAISEGKSGCPGEIRKDELGVVHRSIVALGRSEPGALNVVLGTLKRGEGPRVDFGVDCVDKVIENGTISH